LAGEYQANNRRRRNGDRNLSSSPPLVNSGCQAAGSLAAWTSVPPPPPAARFSCRAGLLPVRRKPCGAGGGEAMSHLLREKARSSQVTRRWGAMSARRHRAEGRQRSWLCHCVPVVGCPFWFGRSRSPAPCLSRTAREPESRSPGMDQHGPRRSSSRGVNEMVTESSRKVTDDHLKRDAFLY